MTRGGEPQRIAFMEGVPPVTAIRWQDLPDGPEKYQAYLCSRDWAERRNAVYKRCGCVCERCKANSAGVVHHLTYARKYHEAPEDLQALCRGCHEFIHGHSDVDPEVEAEKAKRQPRPLVIGDKSDQYAWFDDGSAYPCPYCGCGELHLSQPNWTPPDASMHEQGEITVPMQCEQGCRFSVVLHGYKGRVTARTEYHSKEPI